MVSVKAKIATTATEALKAIWQERFFSTWKAKGPIVETLSKRGNHFSDPELGMALMRARYLTRRGKRGQYQYIQKYPFVSGEAESMDRKEGGKK